MSHASRRGEWLPHHAAANLRDKVPLEEEEDEGDEDTGSWARSSRDEGKLRGEGRAEGPPDGDRGGDGSVEYGNGGGQGEGDESKVALARRRMLGRELSDLLVQDSFLIVPDAEPSDCAELYPPKNFAMVYKGVFRSAYPTKKNFTFLEKLGLKSIIYLCQEDYSRQVMQFYEERGVTVYAHGVSGNKEPFVDISDEMINTALQRLLDVRYHPVLIHCNQGKHRTGSLVGCLRAMNHWSMTAIFDEYRRFAGSKARRADQQFIELFHRKCPVVPTDPKYHPQWFLG